MHRLVLFVDEEQNAARALESGLRRFGDDWTVAHASGIDEASSFVADEQVDALVVSTDITSGALLEFLESPAGRSLLGTTPIVVLAPAADRPALWRTIAMGATDILTKPVEPSHLVGCIGSLMRLKAVAERLRVSAGGESQARNPEWNRLSYALRLAKIAEMRTEETGNHVIRVACYAEEIARQLRLMPGVRRGILLSGMLHDIGLIAVPDSVVLKKCTLSADEWAMMRRHCEVGAEMLRDPILLAAQFAECGLSVPAGEPPSTEDLAVAAAIALSHHERWDGNGYPQKLREEGIPIEARIVALADAFDALTTDRSYRPAVGENLALEILMADQGSHFDPWVFDGFVECFHRIKCIRLGLTDRDSCACERVA